MVRASGATRLSIVALTTPRSVGCLLLALVTLIQGCSAGWRQPPLLTPGPWDPGQQVQVWQGDRVRRWHGFLLTADTASGIPYTMPLACDSCRERVPRGQIDSIRVGNPEAGFWKTVGLVLAIPVVTLVAVCAGGKGGPPCGGN